MRVSTQSNNPGEENSPAAPAGIRTSNLSITSPALLPTGCPGVKLIESYCRQVGAHDYSFLPQLYIIRPVLSLQGISDIFKAGCIQYSDIQTLMYSRPKLFFASVAKLRLHPLRIYSVIGYILSSFFVPSEARPRLFSTLLNIIISSHIFKL